MRRRRPYSHRRQKRSLELLWPFLVLIFVGVILILIIQFVMTWLDQRQAELKNKVYFYLDEGTAQVLPWGATEWAKAYNQLVLEGDVIRMGPSSRGVLKFFNGTLVRLDADTKLEIDKIASDKNEDLIHLNVESGHAWMNVAELGDPLRFVVTTDNLRVTSFGTIFEVGQTDREMVRVMEGEVMVEVLENESEREIVLDQVKVGVGQQVKVTANDVAQIQSRLPVSLLQAVDDDWKDTSWFVWNSEEDLNPTNFEGRTIGSQEASVFIPVKDTTVPLEEDLVEDDPEEDVVVDESVPVVMVVVPSSNPYALTDEQVKSTYSIHGTTSKNTSKVTVTSYDADGVASPYALSHYVAGETTWRYGVSHKFGNLREGRNLFTVVAENALGVKSQPIEVIVNVPEGAFVEEGVVETEEAVTLDETSSEEDVVPVSDEPLTAPTVVSLNNASLPASGRYTSSADAITIVGSVSESAIKVFVDNYQLSKYVPGSGEWSYVVRPDFLNYEVGLNTYIVVAEDADGNQKSFTFEIYRQAP